MLSSTPNKSIQNSVNLKFINFCLSNLYFHKVAFLAAFCLLLFSSIVGQTNYQVSNGVSSANLASGSPTGSYSLTGFESVNPFSGKVNFSLPLFKLQGRGDAGYGLNISIQRNWSVLHTVNDPNTYRPNSEVYFIQNTYTPSDGSNEITYDTDLTPGMMKGTRVGTNFNMQFCAPYVPCYDETLTRLSFVQSDGTEIEFKDVQYGGKPVRHYNDVRLLSRGTVWVSGDGSKATFISNTDIYDDRLKALGVGDPFYPSGTLYLANGTKYTILNGQVTQIIDINGNKVIPGKDSLGREVTFTHVNNPEPNVSRVKKINFKGVGGTPRVIKVNYSFLENRLQTGYSITDLWGLFPTVPRPAEYPYTPYNPEVISEVVLPDNRKYEFRYNNYGELTEILLPTGAKIEYIWQSTPGAYGSGAEITEPSPNGPPLDSDGFKIYRRVEKRRVYEGNELKTETVYTPSGDVILNPTSFVTVDNYSKENGNLVLKGRTKHYFYGGPFPYPGYPVHPTQVQNGLYGKEFKTEVYDSNGTLRQRTLQNWSITAPSWWSAATECDPRILGTVGVAIEGGQALATLSKTEYDDNGISDRTYFSHLNAKRGKSYHYKILDLNTAQTADYQTISGMFTDAGLASVSETDYQYDAGYKTRGITSLSTESRSLNPTNLNDVLAKSQPKYDEVAYPLIPLSTSIGWEDPNSNLRANVTSTRTWVKETGSWLETHAQYDSFGHLRKAWDISGDPSRYTETEYAALHHYGFPTKVIVPPPDPTGTTGTNASSIVETTYDFDTGLPLTVKDDFGNITATEYDLLERPKRSYPLNYTAPETQIEYGDVVGNLYVKVRQQIDANNWDEATQFIDSLGKTFKTQATDSQGDVFTETKYDNLGRVKWTSNPYRLGDTKYWSRPRYDEFGRVYESCAPVEESQINFNDSNSACPSIPNIGGTSLGTTSLSFSTVSGFVGTVVTSTNASGRKSRSITNALGQLLRVDEATAAGGTADADLGTLANPTQPTYYNYSPQGQMVKVQQGKTGDQYIQYRYFLYDSLGRLIRVRQPEQEINSPALDKTDPITSNNQWTTAFTYDVLGNLKRATDANGTNIINEYDKANRLIKKCYTVQNITTNALNCSEVTANLDSNTPQVEYFYDGKGLEGSVAPRAGTVNQAFAKGHLTKVKSAVSETRYTQFDELGWLRQMEQRTPYGNAALSSATPQVSSYEYNFAGALTKETYPSGRIVQNDYESDGDLSRIYGKGTSNSTERTYANAFNYLPDGRIEKLRLGNGRWEWAKFNSRLQVTEMALGRGGNDASLWDLKYEYGELESNGVDVNAAKNTGNIAKQTLNFAGLTNPIVQTFRYDSLYRLKESRETSGTGTSAPQTWKEIFDYDRFGNREALQHKKYIGTTEVSLDSKTNPIINKSSNRLETGPGFYYDKNGNIIQDPGDVAIRTFVFDGNNKQKFVVQYGKPVGEYFYDGEGNRVKKVVYESDSTVVKEETIFVYSSGKLVEEYSTKPLPANPTTSYTATDQLGSPRVITNSLGEVISRRDFMPFGEEITKNIGERQSSAMKYGEIDNIRQKFTGYQKDDETSLDFAEARMYENRHGRFTAVDPLLASGKSANPQSFNRFVYVLNNPIVLTDPSGLQTMSNPNDRDDDGIVIDVDKTVIEEGELIQADSCFSCNLLETMRGWFGIKSSGDFFGRVSSSDALQNANGFRLQTRLNGYQEGPFPRLFGFGGPSVDDVLQQTTDSYRAAHTISEWGFLFSNLFLNAASMTRAGGAYVTSNRGVSLSSDSPTARASIAREEFYRANPNMRKSSIVGAADPNSNLAAADVNGDIPEVVGPIMKANAEKAGGLGFTIPGTRLCVGRCAEFRVANTLELQGANPNNLVFTRPERMRPNRGVWVDVCQICRTWTVPGQFPLGTEPRNW